MTNELLGWLASALVLAAFCARQMVSLRTLAIISNLAFIGYGYLDHIWPVVVLHAAMLPINAIRLRETLLASRGRPADGRALPRMLLRAVPLFKTKGVYR
jgi:hypothetical protein